MGRVISETGTKGFLLWLKANQPKLYADFVRGMSSGVSGLNCCLGNTSLPQGMDSYSMEPGRDVIVGARFLGVIDEITGQNIPDPIPTATTNATTSSWADAAKNLIMSAGQAYLTKTQLDAQGKILDAQLERAKMGLPPLNINPASYGLQPTIGVGLTSSTQNLVLYGGIALLALLAFGILKPSRK
jgi:hypothetical protein